MSRPAGTPAVVWWVECGDHLAELYDDGRARCSCGASWTPEPYVARGYRHDRYVRAQLDVHVQWAGATPEHGRDVAQIENGNRRATSSSSDF